MLVGDLCLSVIPASPVDSGLFQREAYLSGAYPAWRLSLLLVTGLLGMALGFFAVRANYMQIKPQNCKLRLAVLISGVIYLTSAGMVHTMVVRRFKERSIEGSHAKFTWGIKNGKKLAAILPGFRFREEHCLTEGMAVFVPVYKLLDKLAGRAEHIQ